MAFKAISSPTLQAPMLRFYSARAAPQTGLRRETLQREGPRLTKLSNGIVVASMENNHPITRIALAVKAGSRYEEYYNLGVTHSLRNCCGLTNKSATIFGTTRNLQLMGTTVTATNTRELMIYTMEVNRDKLKDSLKYFIPMICEQEFYPWEIRDFEDRIKFEVADYQQRPNVVVLETLHKVAFRTGLGNSVYTPDYMIGRHDTESLTKFFKSSFATNRMALATVGMNHESAVDIANFFRYEGTATIQEVPTKYGGGEKRIEKVSPYSHVMIAANAAGLKNPKESLSAAVLQQMLGTYPQIKRGMTRSKLFTAAAKATENPFAVSCLNFSYSDAGLFGFYVAGQAEDMSKLVKCLVDEVSAVKNGVDEKDVQIGKARVKAAMHMAMENGTDSVQELACQALHYGKVYDAAELDALIDSITPSDVNSIAKKITNGKPSMAAVGNLIDTPYLDQIR
uniref:Peptidase M16 N-terminal domain-containing protein n=1 Tax=Strigamia maritima TaxID=126957 RepID=T1J887_STRMM